MGSLNNQSHLTIHAEYYNMRPQWFWVENESWKSTHVALLKSSCECHLWSKKPRIQGDVLLYPEVVQHDGIFAYIMYFHQNVYLGLPTNHSFFLRISLYIYFVGCYVK